MYLLLLIIAQWPARKHPSLTALTMAAAIFLTLLVGYELESERLGEAVIVSRGQPYHQPYLLSWMALLAVMAGVGIAAFWTLFPYPILETQLLSQKLADSINTLAELHLQTHFAVYDAVKNHKTDEDRTRHRKVVSDIQLEFIASLAGLRQLLGNSKYQVQIGGIFPRQLHTSLVDNIDSLFRSVSLVVWASRTFSTLDAEAVDSPWMIELRRVASRNEDIEHRTLSVLTICADAIERGRPLPPFLDVPETSSLLAAIKTSPMDLLSSSHAVEPGFSALAAIHASAEMVTEEIRELVRMTEELVGRVEFLDYQDHLA